MVDGGLGLPDPYLPDHTDQRFAAGEFNKDIEVMIGKTNKSPSIIALFIIIIGTNKDESILFMLTTLNGMRSWEDPQATFEPFYAQIMFNNQSDLIY